MGAWGHGIFDNDDAGGSVRAELVPLALAAVRRAREGSELRELWDEAEPDDWLAEVADLERRLRSAT